MNPIKFAELLRRYRTGDCTNEEKKLIEDWYNSRLQPPYLSLSETEEALAGETIKQRIDSELEQINEHHNTVPLWRRRATRWVAAASVLALATVTYLMLRNTPPAKQPVAANKTAKPVAVPGGNKAVLTLADGSVIVLDSAANGQLTTQGATMVLKRQDGQLVYEAGAKATADSSTAWNTISTPRGGQYQVILPDGSQVWLNAASSLRFPASFARNERKVELIGEAYFEVAKNAGQPFRVHFTSGDRTGEVEVLGTHFNIMAYNDEDAINTTLLEGKVVLRSGEANRTLLPGQQGRLLQDGTMELYAHADTEEAIAWKNGLFQFNNADVQTVMRQLARWYDVTVEYKSNVPDEKFEGEIPRTTEITEVCKMLELSNVHCKVEGKKIIVLP